MSRARIGSVSNHRNGSVTIAGLTHDDCRLIAQAIRAGAWDADRGGPYSDALMRFEALLRTAPMFPNQHAPIRFTTGGHDPAALFEEVYP